MKNYIYEWTIRERGYSDISFKEFTQCQQDKFNYVLQYLRPAMHEANCGWKNVDYHVMCTSSGIKSEFVVLWSGEINHSGSRWINVTGESMGSIMCSVCDNLW